MASKCKTSYPLKWEEDFSWLKKSKVVDCAHCKLCNKSFRIDGGGIAQVKSHHRSKSHKDRKNIISGSSNQRTFIVGSKTVNLSSGAFVLTHEESVVKAEILQALQSSVCRM